jgi:hypothetical protein
MTSGLVLAIGVLALASSCARPTGGPASMRGPSGSTLTPGATAPAAPGTVNPADVPPELRFTAPRLGGGTVRGADFAGHDLVMWFWAPW